MAPVLLAMMLATQSRDFGLGQPKILKFQDGAQAAVSLQFDDSMMSQLDNAVPLLNARKIRATFFVNTGSYQYGQRRQSWEIDLPKTGHEIANHTVHHKGAKTVEELQAEIGGCSDDLAKVFGPKPRSSLSPPPAAFPGISTETSSTRSSRNTTWSSPSIETSSTRKPPTPSPSSNASWTTEPGPT